MSFAYMPFYTGDYYRDTRHLSMLQHGAYRQLLDHCWDQKGPLPLDETRCYRICGAVSKEEQDAVRSVIDEFFTRMEDGHYNRRMQLEIEKCNSISGARAGAAHARWAARDAINRIDVAEQHANALQVHSKSNASGPSSTSSSTSSPASKEKTPLSDKSDDVLFTTFWKSYPKKVGKDAAAKAFVKRKPTKRLLAEMLNALEAQKSSHAWTKDGGQFVPQPATWLNQGRWKDEFTESTSNSIFEGAQ
jgi:uncharacterized protein YdaU (DUF1376 family)